ncbi:MAG: DUF5009 domain-containing protein [Alistipes sp.]|jgi:hypothetical protein|nr:DUF5009 domain-containing protein [Alistipes sp.]
MATLRQECTATQAPTRIAAIDVFRALTMFFMLFVNDMAGLENIPHRLEHAAASEDMMGFSDTIFPAFLFIMGMSIPLAVHARRRRGGRLPRIAAHIALRSVALVAMGLFTVNLESLDWASTPIGGAWWAIAMTAAFFLVWAVYPRTDKRWKRTLFAAMKVIGVGILICLAVTYQGRGGSGFGVRWWGILGLIGWTYLVSAAVYLVVRDRVVWNFVAWGAFVVWCVLDSAGIVGNPVPGSVALHALGVSGLLVSSLMRRWAVPTSKMTLKTTSTTAATHAVPWRFFGWLAGLAAVMAVAGILAHGHWIVSKIEATPTWLFWCLAIFLPLLGIVYFLTEIRGKARWFDFIAPAGTLTLTCYMVPYVWYAVRGLLGVARPEVLQSGWLGLAGSLLFAWLCVAIAGAAGKYLKVRLKV